MFYEYAIEPQAIGSSWATFRYLIEKFGFDQGRLISEFPRRWLREVYEATNGLPDVEKKKISVALEQARKNKVARFGRPYDRSAGDWLHNAIAEHQRLPFHAIISARNPTGNRSVLIAADLDEHHPLMSAARDFSVPRDAVSLSAAMREMLCFGSRIVFVDPFYDPYNARYKETFRKCLEIIASQNSDAVCEIHYRVLTKST
ncbi:hypothetical protein WOB59_00620 [Methylocystis sp. IM4]|uniref:hypothetical protein n=1 Tax=Methylocystis sp. IM4 TaxID=3136560 RepID=UPI00311A612D